MVCPKCGTGYNVGDWPFCPHGKGANSVVADDIPGGIEIKHGLCNEDGTPRKYYSKSEMAKEAKRRGLANVVTHVTEPGTDKAKYTTSWTSVPLDEETRLKHWHEHEKRLTTKSLGLKSDTS